MSDKHIMHYLLNWEEEVRDHWVLHKKTMHVTNWLWGISAVTFLFFAAVSRSLLCIFVSLMLLIGAVLTCLWFWLLHLVELQWFEYHRQFYVDVIVKAEQQIMEDELNP